MAATLQALFLQAGFAAAPAEIPTVTAQPNVWGPVKPYFIDPARSPKYSQAEIQALLRKKIKYVFVIFNENHSFDNEYGTFPGVNGIYSDGVNPRSAQNTPGFFQNYTGANGVVQVTPFLIGPEQNATAVDSVDHSHTGLATKMNLVNGEPTMDKYAYDEYHRFASKGGAANIAEGTQFARLVMSHIDGDTIPFFWQWASRFTIFDNIFATEDTPSTPNAVSMIAGQAGETQWVKHGPKGQTYVFNHVTSVTQGPPLMNDPQPFWGSQFDTTTTNKQPRGSSSESYANSNIASNLTFATVPLTLMGSSVNTITAQDLDPTFDLPDIKDDITEIAKLKTTPVNWRWYQEGYDLESTDTGGVDSHNGYVSHHQGPQYFGYLANNPAVRSNFRGMTDFFTDIENNNLPKGGVFYIRGGYQNQMGLTPPITNPDTPLAEIAAIDAAKGGDDDHPSYSDRQLSEAMAARVINAVAGNPEIWNQCAIIITYDESDGYYDHVPPRILSYGPDGLPQSRGARVPLILISPFARTHCVSHVEGDHNSVIETINAIFGLPALSSLPDEAQALVAGNSPAFNQFGPAGFQQKYLGPRDTNSAITDSLLSGFEPLRLIGYAPTLPASLATIPADIVNTLPHYGGRGCLAIGIIPEDVRQGIVNTVPAGFNPLPSTYPAAN